MLYPGSSKPLYEQLKDVLKQKIEAGEFKPGDALPGERQLMATYSVSRITVRQAIAQLVQEGLIYRRHGKGNFVAPKRIERPLARLWGVAEELKLAGFAIQIQVLNTRFRKVPAEIADKLQIADGVVFELARLITADSHPILIDYSFFPQTIGKLLENTDLSQDLIYHQLELYGYKIIHGQQNISAGLVSLEDSKLLECEPRSPALILKRTTYVEGETPIEYSHTIYRADRYEYQITLQRRPLGNG